MGTQDSATTKISDNANAVVTETAESMPATTISATPANLLPPPAPKEDRDIPKGEELLLKTGIWDHEKCVRRADMVTILAYYTLYEQNKKSMTLTQAYKQAKEALLIGGGQNVERYKGLKVEDFECIARFLNEDRDDERNLARKEGLTERV